MIFLFGIVVVLLNLRLLLYRYLVIFKGDVLLKKNYFIKINKL